MILPFSTQLNGKPTYFVEKIWETILQKGIQIKMNDFLELGRKALPKNYIVGTHKPKFHTMREDSKDRWKVGTLIDFFINCRQKNMFRFAPRIPVVSIQKIEIKYSGGEINTVDIYIDEQCYVANYSDSYNSSLQRQRKVETLAQNDGFDTVEEFFAYFNEDFTGKLIHWTDLKY